MTHHAKIVHIATANPPLKCRQEDILKNVLVHGNLTPRARTFYKRFLSDKGIETRHLGLKNLEDVYQETHQAAIDRFQKVASHLGIEAASRCLKEAHVPAQKIDGLIVTTCTGYLCPGLSSYISEKLGFRDNIFVLDLVGIGCGAAMPALNAAREFLKSSQYENVLVVSIEVSSAAISWGDETDLVLSNAIFSDGAAAALVTNRPAKGFEFLSFESILWPQHRDDLRFKHREARLCNVINKNVPEIAAKAVKTLAAKLKKIAADYRFYAIHPGGRRILDCIQQSLELGDDHLVYSREILKNYGNMSSPSVLFVLKNIFDHGHPKAHDKLLMFAFGAGFSAFGSVLEYKS